MAGICYVPGGDDPLRDVVFRCVLAEKENGSVMYQVPSTNKHRVWSPKHRLVRNIPETFKGLGLSQQTAFCPQKAMLAGIMQIALMS